MASDEFIAELSDELDFAYDRTCHLADAVVRVRATAKVFPGEEYISARAWADAGTADRTGYDFIWVERDALTNSQLSRAQSNCETGFRGERFATGFYLTHHHGSPALLLRGDRRTMVVGGNADRVFWSYYVKVLLSQHAWLTGGLHLKAGALNWRGKSILVVGRGGGGKTHLTVLGALAGAELVSNTHVLLRDQEIHGVASTMRLRGSLADHMRADGRALTTHFEKGEHLFDPSASDLTTSPTGEGPDVIVLTDFHGGGEGLSPLDTQTAMAFVEHFAWPVTTYAMKYDVWDIAGGDLGGFATYIESEMGRLRSLVESTPFVRFDRTIESPADASGALDDVLEMLD